MDNSFFDIEDFSSNSLSKKTPLDERVKYDKEILSNNFYIPDNSPQSNKLIKYKLVLTSNHLNIFKYESDDDLRYQTELELSKMRNHCFYHHENFQYEYGIKFTKYLFHETFYTDSSQIWEAWGRELAKNCVQTNFDQKYTILSKIGDGTYSTVYKIKSKLDGTEYAVKQFVKKENLKNHLLKKSLCNQIKLMRGIDHPNL